MSSGDESVDIDMPAIISTQKKADIEEETIFKMDYGVVKNTPDTFKEK